MHEISLAFFWHQHQPYYPDDTAHENPMPWVRLHGTKDYWGMAMLLYEAPEIRATINLVPSLLVQLAAYTDHGHEDTHLRVSRMPVDNLAESDTHYLLDNFFMVHPDHMIRPHRRYQELFQKRGLGIDSPERARKRFSKKDLLDLQCWGNLAWFHPLAFEKDPELAEFCRKERNWTEQDKAWLLQKQMEILRQIVPLHRQLMERGQVELTTTPFYHPILPLLFDKRLARQAMPDVPLPRYLEGYPEDAIEHVRRAMRYHEQLFGQRPRGMWPAEGSVCQEMIPALADVGLRWIATDEEILSCATAGKLSRDSNGFLRNPEMLYRPWQVDQQGKSLQVVFRDHALSDMIGFHYQHLPADQAVYDLVSKLEAIGQATSGSMGRRPALVSIILDGENCWEYYPHSGADFLRGLYRRLANHPHIKTVRISDYLRQYPAADKLGPLFPGSWIQHNFGIWIGQPECNHAWDMLHQTRQFLKATENRSPQQMAQAWEELYIAEGSDWFWWFDGSHTSAQDALFDRLFRKHLQNVYTLLGEEPPAELARPINQGHRPPQLSTMPTGLLRVKINGRRGYFEWVNAGHWIGSGSRGAMSMVQEGLVSDLYFGFDLDRLLLRLDARSGSVHEQFAVVDTVRIVFQQPAGFETRVENPSSPQPVIKLLRDNIPITDATVEAAADTILEMAIPFRSLAVRADDPISFVVELLRNRQPIERIPFEGAMETAVPSPDYEQIMWQV